MPGYLSVTDPAVCICCAASLSIILSIPSFADASSGSGAGHAFSQAANGGWLTDHVLPRLPVGLAR
jgi:hypothetical protein